MTGNPRGPAYRIETQRLVIRCFEPEHAPAFRALLDANDDYLRPWIPWMKAEPLSLEDTIRRVRGFRARFDRDEEFRYAVFDRSGSRMIAMTGLHARGGEGVLEIGYFVDRNVAGKGVAAEMAMALTRAAFEIHGVRRVEIICATGNHASQRVPERLGFLVDHAEHRRGENSEGTVDDLVVWALHAPGYPGSPAAAFEMRAYDCLGVCIAGTPAVPVST